MLRAIAGSHRSGPYFISVSEPYQPGEPLTKPYLFQDHSWSDPDFIWLWTKAFLNQAEQQKYWKENRLETFAINLRQLLRVMSHSFKRVNTALNEVSDKELLGKILFSK